MGTKKCARFISEELHEIIDHEEGKMKKRKTKGYRGRKNDWCSTRREVSRLRKK